jgi:isopentenyl-diphosphate delta-isomerase
MDLQDIDTSCIFMGKRLKAPLMVNAITGGHPETAWINRELSLAAGKAGIGMAVGSQRAALNDASVRDTFAVARTVNPEGLVLANLGANCTPEEARAAVEMINADGIQLHLNVPQEIAMPEGDSCFKGVLANITSVINALDVPVMVKEVGFGISRETALALHNAGVKCIDIGGRGGTDFIAIEHSRGNKSRQEPQGWGIPTAASLLEVLSLGLDVKLVASGGLRGSLDMARALMAGASLTAMARPFLEALVKGSAGALEEMAANLIDGLGKIMLLTGSANLSELAVKPLVITGFTAEWLTRRGVDIDRYARR